jgi:hypothetical protein
MLPSRCTVLVLGVALGLGLPASSRAGESPDPSSSGPVRASPRLVEQGVAAYQVVRQDPQGGGLWWLFDADSTMLGTLEYRPPDTHVLSFGGDVLVARYAPPRAVLELNGRLGAWKHDRENRRVVADSPEAESVLNAARPRLKLLTALIEAITPNVGGPRVSGPAGVPPRKGGEGDPVPLEEEAPCQGEWRGDWGVAFYRSQACGIATAGANNKCRESSTGACPGCCRFDECDCVCIPDTDYACECSRWGQACVAGCPPSNPPSGSCQPQNCSINCYQVAIDRVPQGHRVIGGTCSFGSDCECDAWVNTCNPANNARDTVYSLVQRCPGECPPPCNSIECYNECGYGTCQDPNPTCCFDSYCGPPNADCCSDGGSCPSGWECCDDGTSSCCPNGYRCCWLEDGPMCCDYGGDTSPDETAVPRSTHPRLQKNQPAIAPKSPKE